MHLYVWLSATLLASVPGGDAASPQMGRVQVVGSGDRDVILMPCLGCDGRSWDTFMERNRERFRMWAVTWPGMGDTPLPTLPASSKGTPYFDHLVEALRRLILDEQLRRPILVGHSAAAVLAVRFAHEHPELIAGVVNVDAIVANLDTHGFSPVRRLAWADEEMADALAQYDNEAAWRSLNAPPKSLPDRARAAFYSQMWLLPPRGNVFAYWRDWVRTDAGSRLPELRVPFVAIHALSPDQDQAKETRSDLEKRYALAPMPPGARVVYVPESGHFIWEHQPRAFDEALAEFVFGSAAAVAASTPGGSEGAGRPGEGAATPDGSMN